MKRTIYTLLGLSLLTMLISCPGRLDSNGGCSFKPREISDENAYRYAKNAAVQLRNNCIKIGGANFFDVEVLSKMVDQETEKVVIELKAEWEGGISGIEYWFEGKLICDPNGLNANWRMTNECGLLGGCVKDRELSDVRY